MLDQFIVANTTNRRLPVAAAGPTLHVDPVSPDLEPLPKNSELAPMQRC